MLLVSLSLLAFLFVLAVGVDLTDDDRAKLLKHTLARGNQRSLDSWRPVAPTPPSPVTQAVHDMAKALGCSVADVVKMLQLRFAASIAGSSQPMQSAEQRSAPQLDLSTPLARHDSRPTQTPMQPPMPPPMPLASQLPGLLLPPPPPWSAPSLLLLPPPPSLLLPPPSSFGDRIRIWI